MAASGGSLRAVTFEITSTLVCMSVPLGQVYGDQLRHFKLPCPPDETMKAAFKAAYKKVGVERPNFGAADGTSERAWWVRMIDQTLREAVCRPRLEPTRLARRGPHSPHGMSTAGYSTARGHAVRHMAMWHGKAHG